jgi:NADH-quinone oxidoreductase subunit G
MSDDLITLTINGREVRVPKGTLLVEAAKQVGLEIPVFCYHPKLAPVGACRMCLVEIEKMPRLQTACTTPVADGMVVRSDSPGALAAQNGVIEMLLANHPLDCPVCDKGGECPLQDNTFKYGLGFSRMLEEKRHLDKAFPLSERIVLDKERCILCYRCVRFQREIPGDEALCVIDRGAYGEIGTLPGETFDSIFSGNTIEICPVGALTSRQYRFRARPWDLRRTASVCAGCAVGCNVELHARDGKILRMVARENPAVDDGWLCDTGRFDTLPPLAGNRPLRPLVRQNGGLEPASWDEALARAAVLLGEQRSAVLASPSLTNEALWLLAGPLRQALAGRPIGFWPSVEGGWPVQGAIEALPGATRLVVAGLDPWSALPILALWLRKAALRGGKLVVIGPRNGLFRDTATWLRVDEQQIGATLARLADGLAVGEAEGDQQAGEADEQAALLRRAADDLRGEGPFALLVGSALAREAAGRAQAERLAARLSAGGPAALVGSPSLAANGRGVQEIAPELTAAEVGEGHGALLLLGPGHWPDQPGTRLIVATSGPFDEREAVEVVLPLCHPYEQAGSLTSLEGRVQKLEPSGFGAPTTLPDWSALARLVQALGGQAPGDLNGIRAALAADRPSFARALSGGLPPRGRRLEAGVA